jgi:hypothetical protein
MSHSPRRTYLNKEMTDALIRRAKAQGRSESRLIADAVGRMLSDNTEAAIKADENTVKRQLNRIEARLDALITEQARIRDWLLTYVRIWFEYNPQLEDEIMDAAAVSAEARFISYLGLSREGFALEDEEYAEEDQSVEPDQARNGRRS